jgi:hypothetical protein
MGKPGMVPRRTECAPFSNLDFVMLSASGSCCEPKTAFAICWHRWLRLVQANLADG